MTHVSWRFTFSNQIWRSRELTIPRLPLGARPPVATPLRLLLTNWPVLRLPESFHPQCCSSRLFPLPTTRRCQNRPPRPLGRKWYLVLSCRRPRCHGTAFYNFPRGKLILKSFRQARYFTLTRISSRCLRHLSPQVNAMTCGATPKTTQPVSPETGSPPSWRSIRDCRTLSNLVWCAWWGQIVCEWDHYRPQGGYLSRIDLMLYLLVLEYFCLEYWRREAS